jgi:hypothetical protein
MSLDVPKPEKSKQTTEVTLATFAVYPDTDREAFIAQLRSETPPEGTVFLFSGKPGTWSGPRYGEEELSLASAEFTQLWKGVVDGKTDKVDPATMARLEELQSMLQTEATVWFSDNPELAYNFLPAEGGTIVRLAIDAGIAIRYYFDGGYTKGYGMNCAIPAVFLRSNGAESYQVAVPEVAAVAAETEDAVEVPRTILIQGERDERPALDELRNNDVAQSARGLGIIRQWLKGVKK